MIFSSMNIGVSHSFPSCSASPLSISGGESMKSISVPLGEEKLFFCFLLLFRRCSLSRSPTRWMKEVSLVALFSTYLTIPRSVGGDSPMGCHVELLLLL